MKIISDSISLTELRKMAAESFYQLVKAVVDVERATMAVDAELHSDLEAALLEQGSRQANLWGINIYPDKPVDSCVDFDSMINLRPSQGNKSRGVDDEGLRRRIIAVVEKRISR